MIDRIESPSATARIGWRAGLLSMFAVFFGSLFVGAAIWWRSGSPGAASSAAFSGLVAGWFAYLGILRRGVLRGWWA